MENRPLKEHRLEVTNRNFLKITGIEAVDAITEKETSMKVLGGGLSITGVNLKAETLNVESGTLVLSGLVENIKYTNKKEKTGLLKKIFK